VKEITEQDVIEALNNYKKEYPENNFTDPHYEKDWRKLTCSYDVVYEKDEPYPIKKIYQYISKYKTTEYFTTEEAERKIHKYFRIGTIKPAEYFKDVLNEEKAKLVTPINTDVEKENSETIVKFQKVLNDLKELSNKINSNIDELNELVNKIGK
jgi:hypothetical protein